MMDYLARAEQLEDRLREIRQDLHRHPEIGNHEFYTSSLIERTLKELGFEVTHMLDTALVGRMKFADGGKTVALRADMDALPVTEATGCGFESENPGMMHACGHDIHMTAALGTAMLLSENRENLKGEVVLLFEPDEEGSGGAQRMIEKGAMKGVDAVFGGHVTPDLPLGTVGVMYGKFYAASDVITVHVHGKSCHGATPEKGHDALLAASGMVTGLTSLRPSSGDRAVLTIGQFESGTACNVIADEAFFKGIVRTLGNTDRLEMRQMILDVVDTVSKKYGVKTDLEIGYSYAGVVNTENETRVLESSAQSLLGKEKVVRISEPSMTTEDFGYFIDECCGTFCNIGAGCTQPLHSPTFIPDVRAAVIASAVYAKTIDNYLK